MSTTSAEQFNCQARHYDEQWNRWSEENLRWMLEHAAPRATDRVLDVGTGTGFTALAFAPHVASVVGLDVSSGMLDQARRRAGGDRQRSLRGRRCREDALWRRDV